MPGIETYLFDSIGLELKSRAGWILPVYSTAKSTYLYSLTGTRHILAIS
jgi:hypothetical protein